MRVDDGGYTHPTPWDSPDWRADALAWISGCLAGRGWSVGGPLDVRLRPWSVVIRLPVSTGPGARAAVWFKANPPGSAWEPALMRALAGWAPEAVLTPIAVDTGRSWSLNPDGGALLRPHDPDEPPGGFWRDPVDAYARLQRATVDRVPELIALGLPDLRPAALPALLDTLLDRFPVPEVSAARSRVADWCAELAAGPVPAALDHSDLHENQVFTGGGYRVFDWGDASVAHPYTSLLVTARVIRRRYGERATPIVERMRDAYLGHWDADLPTARRLARLACRVGPIGRATTWGRVFPGAPVDGGIQIRTWLSRLLDEPPI